MVRRCFYFFFNIFIVFISPHYNLSLKLKFSNYFITVFLSCTQIGFTFHSIELLVSTLNRSECSGRGSAGGRRSVGWFV